MLKYIIRRILLVIPVLLGVMILVFTINYFTSSSPAITILGADATTELVEELEHEMGLDRPYIVQLVAYLKQVIIDHSLGESYIYDGVGVLELISQRLGNTLKISLPSVLVAILIGVPLGIWAAIRQNTVIDYATTTFAIVLSALPGFCLAFLLILFFSVKLRCFPVSGADGIKNFILPVFSAGSATIAQNARMTRSSMLEVIRQDYIRTARSKGVPERSVIWKHALKNALIPVITVVGTSLGGCLGGSIVVEKIFNIPGMGTLIRNSITNRDYITVQGCVLVCAVMVVFMILLTDLAYAVVDPRIRAQYESSVKKANKAKKTGETAEGGEQA